MTIFEFTASSIRTPLVGKVSISTGHHPSIAHTFTSGSAALGTQLPVLTPFPVGSALFGTHWLLHSLSGQSQRGPTSGSAGQKEGV